MHHTLSCRQLSLISMRGASAENHSGSNAGAADAIVDKKPDVGTTIRQRRGREAASTNLFGNLPYDPVLLKRFQNTILSSNEQCSHPILVDDVWRFCGQREGEGAERGGEYRVHSAITLYTIVRMQGELVLRTSECSIDTPSDERTADESESDAAGHKSRESGGAAGAEGDHFLLVAAGEDTHTALALLEQRFPAVLSSVTQMVAAFDVCSNQPSTIPQTDSSSSEQRPAPAWAPDPRGLQTARSLCSVQHFTEHYGFISGHSHRVPATFRSAALSETLLIAGFPRGVCRYNVHYSKASTEEHTRRVAEAGSGHVCGEEKGGKGTEALTLEEREAMDTIVLDHIHDCPPEESFLLQTAERESKRGSKGAREGGARERKQDVKNLLKFPGGNLTRFRVSDLRSGMRAYLPTVLLRNVRY